MIVDVLDPPVTTIWVAFDAFEHDHVEETIISGKEWLKQRSGWELWRFQALHVNWAEGRIELDFLRES